MPPGGPPTRPDHLPPTPFSAEQIRRRPPGRPHHRMREESLASPPPSVESASSKSMNRAPCRSSSRPMPTATPSVSRPAATDLAGPAAAPPSRPDATTVQEVTLGLPFGAFEAGFTPFGGRRPSCASGSPRSWRGAGAGRGMDQWVARGRSLMIANGCWPLGEGGGQGGNRPRKLGDKWVIALAGRLSLRSSGRGSDTGSCDCINRSGTDVAVSHRGTGCSSFGHFHARARLLSPLSGATSTTPIDSDRRRQTATLLNPSAARPGSEAACARGDVGWPPAGGGARSAGGALQADRERQVQDEWRRHRPRRTAVASTLPRETPDVAASTTVRRPRQAELPRAACSRSKAPSVAVWSRGRPRPSPESCRRREPGSERSGARRWSLPDPIDR
jgi:hypothetical protein